MLSFLNITYPENSTMVSVLICTPKISCAATSSKHNCTANILIIQVHIPSDGI